MNAYRNTSTTPYPRQGSTGGALPGGFWQSAGGAYTFNPQSNSMVSTQLNDLTTPGANNTYINNARQNAMATAAARGLGNSSYAAGNAERAAIGAALPIATADANTFGQAALANQQSLNQVGMNNLNNQTSRSNANTAANASMYGSNQSRIASEYGQNAETERQQEQNQFNSQFQPYMLGLQNQYGAQDWARNTYGNILQGAYGTMYSNPDYFNNPDAAMGFINGFGNFANNQIGQYLYGDTGTGGP